MKKIFSVENRYWLHYHSDTSLFEVTRRWNSTKFYLNKQGKEVAYEKVFEDDDFEYEYDDPDMYEDYDVNGSYVFTTHPVREDFDGNYGQFGVKNLSGEIIIPEKYYCMTESHFGTFTACMEDMKWGLLGPNGEEMLPFIYDESLYFNKYEIGYGNGRLIDIKGNEIPNTDFNLRSHIFEDQRYISFTYCTQEELDLIVKHGHLENQHYSIFDSKERKIIFKDISVDVDFEGTSSDSEVLNAAFELKSKYDKVNIYDDGIIVAEKSWTIDVFDFYEEF